MGRKMKLGNQEEGRFDTAGQRLLRGKNLHPLPKVLMPLACNVVGEDDEHQGGGKQAFKNYVVSVEIPSKNKWLPR